MSKSDKVTQKRLNKEIKQHAKSVKKLFKGYCKLESISTPENSSYEELDDLAETREVVKECLVVMAENFLFYKKA